MTGSTRVALSVLLLAVAGACATAAPPPAPSEEAAGAFLMELAGLAASRDFEALCARGSGNCERALDEVGEASAPGEPPTVLGSWVLPASEVGPGTWSLGGRVLTVCGLDGHAQPYRSEVLVFSDDGSLRAIEAVFWNGQGIADDWTVGSEPVPPMPEGC